MSPERESLCRRLDTFLFRLACGFDMAGDTIMAQQCRRHAAMAVSLLDPEPVAAPAIVATMAAGPLRLVAVDGRRVA